MAIKPMTPPPSATFNRTHTPTYSEVQSVEPRTPSDGQPMHPQYGVYIVDMPQPPPVDSLRAVAWYLNLDDCSQLNGLFDLLEKVFAMYHGAMEKRFGISKNEKQILHNVPAFFADLQQDGIIRYRDIISTEEPDPSHYLPRVLRNYNRFQHLYIMRLAHQAIQKTKGTPYEHVFSGSHDRRYACTFIPGLDYHGEDIWRAFVLMRTYWCVKDRRAERYPDRTWKVKGGPVQQLRFVVPDEIKKMHDEKTERLKAGGPAANSDAGTPLVQQKVAFSRKTNNATKEKGMHKFGQDGDDDEIQSHIVSNRKRKADVLTIVKDEEQDSATEETAAAESSSVRKKKQRRVLELDLKKLEIEAQKVEIQKALAQLED